MRRITFPKQLWQAVQRGWYSLELVLVVVRSGILENSIPVAINSVEVALNQDMKAITTRQGLLPGYLAALIRGHQSELLVEWRKLGATVDSLEFDLLANTLIPVPPIPNNKELSLSSTAKPPRSTPSSLRNSG